MENIGSSESLKKAIQLLEVAQEAKGKLLGLHFRSTYESLKPTSLIKSTLKDVTSSPYLIENIVVTLLGLASGYVSKKLVVGTSANIFRKLIGSVVQFGITNIVAQHPEAVSSIGQTIMQKLSGKKEKIATSTVSSPSQTLIG